MSDGIASRQPAKPRATARPGSIPAAYLPGRALWPWCARLYGKLSARDLLALSNAANTENSGSKPEPSAASEPAPPPAALSYTQAWNPLHAKNRQQQNPQTLTGDNAWKSGVSAVEYILVHELSRKYPEAYAYVIRRICEQAGVAVPDTTKPPTGGHQNNKEV